MSCEMGLGKVEICTNTKINEDVFIVMETLQGGIEKVKCFIGVNRVSC